MSLSSYYATSHQEGMQGEGCVGAMCLWRVEVIAVVVNNSGCSGDAATSPPQPYIPSYITSISVL